MHEFNNIMRALVSSRELDLPVGTLLYLLNFDRCNSRTGLEERNGTSKETRGFIPIWCNVCAGVQASKPPLQACAFFSSWGERVAFVEHFAGRTRAHIS
jgi:hypothetical protein